MIAAARIGVAPMHAAMQLGVSASRAAAGGEAARWAVREALLRTGGCWRSSAKEIVGNAYRAMAERPLATTVLLTGAKTCMADLAVQKCWEGKKDIDWRRSFAFTAFGMGYLGGFQFYLWGKCFPRWFPGKGLRTTVTTVIFDQIVNTAMMYLPLFYIMQDGVAKGRFDRNTPINGATRYSKNALSDLTAAWKFWIPAQMLTFSVVPIPMRAGFAAVLSIAWTCVLSAMRGDAKA